jgi:SAM-dependent methyltransferase
VDTARKALDYATQRYGSSRVRFLTPDAARGPFDLCYVNGVFHHIEPPERAEALRVIHASLRTGGLLALFENNPWNPGARMVMNRIAFDRDAHMLSIPHTRRMLRRAGFTAPRTWSLFYFPHFLRFLRPIEPALARLPLGAQYCVLAAKA